MTNYPPPPASPAYGPPADGKPRLRGRIPLRLALILGVLGIILTVAGGVVLAKKTLGVVDDFKRVSISDRSSDVSFTRTGKYIGYYESPTAGKQKAFVRMLITDSSGAPVNLAVYNKSSKLTYDFGNHHGLALFTFSIAKSGTYTVQLESTDAPPGAKMAFGESIANSLVVGVLLIIPGVLLIIAAIVLLIVGLVRRSGHKKQLAQQSYGGPPQNYPPQNYPPQPGYGPPGGPSLSKG
ncbi:MAG: hypothetical protein ABI345_15835 [Jatrophihabitans sp.]